MHLPSSPLCPVEFGHAYAAAGGDMREGFYDEAEQFSWMDAPYWFASGATSAELTVGGRRGFLRFAEPVTECTPPADQASADSLPAPVVAGGGECAPRKGRKARHASDARRVQAHREAHARLDVVVSPQLKASIAGIAAELGFKDAEVIRDMLKFALTNRNWKQVGLTGRGAL